MSELLLADFVDCARLIFLFPSSISSTLASSSIVAHYSAHSPAITPHVDLYVFLSILLPSDGVADHERRPQYHRTRLSTLSSSCSLPWCLRELWKCLSQL